MQKNSVYLFAPNFVAGLGEVTSAYLPYSVASIWSYALTNKVVADNFFLAKLGFVREPIEKIVNEMDNPSICAFSTYIWNECYNLELAKAIKQRFPSCLIQFGGPNVPNQENDYKQWRQAHPWIDTTIRYEGEVSFQNMLLDYLNGTVKKDYVTERMDHLDIPSPYLTGMFDSIIDQGGYTWAMTIETNRGCPFQCTFCDWGSLTYSKIKKFPLQKVLDEITWAGKHKIEFLFIADANFGVFPDRDLEIIEHLITTRGHYGFPSMVATAWYKNSNEVILTLAEKLTAYNLNRWLTLSVQSMNPETLTAIKRQNMRVNNLSALFNECNKRNVPFYTELILGLPKETLTSWCNGHLELIEMGQHGCIFMFPLELLRNSDLNINTDLYGVKGMVIDDYWTCSVTGISEKQHIVVETDTMTTADMIEATLFSWMIITFHHHGWTEIYSRYLRQVQGTSYKEIYNSLKLWLANNQHFNSELTTIQKDVEDFYYKSQATGYYAIWDTVRNLFSNFEESNNLLELWFRTLSDDQHTDQVIELQKKFMTNPADVSDTVVTQPNNLMSVILELDATLTPGEKIYRFSPRGEKWKSLEEFLDLVVLRRKESFGKNKIIDA